MNAETSAAQTGPHWREGRVSSWIFATDHKRIGMLWLAVGGLGILLGGILALISALQTARPDGDLIGQGTYASVVTMQGTLLTYGGILPLALGLAVVIVPLQLGARGLALPGLSAFAFWLGLAGVAAVVLSSFSKGDAPRSSWTSTPSIALDPSRPGETARLMGLFLIALATLLTAIALVATFRGLRAPGMSNDRLPLFAQSAGIFATALLVLASISLLGNGLLLLDRKNPGSFDWYIDGGANLLDGYEWVFSQAIVAIVIVLALGVAAEIVATFHRGLLTHRRLVTLALVAAAVLIALVPSARHRRGQPPGFRAGLSRLAPDRGCSRDAPLRRLRCGSYERPGHPAAVRPGITRPADRGGVCRPRTRRRPRRSERDDVPERSARPDLVGRPARAARRSRLLVAEAHRQDARRASHQPLRLRDHRLVAAARTRTGDCGLERPADPRRRDDRRCRDGVAARDDRRVRPRRRHPPLRARKAPWPHGRRVGNDPWRADTLEWYTTSPPPPHNFDSLPPVTSARPLHDLRTRLNELNAL